VFARGGRNLEAAEHTRNFFDALGTRQRGNTRHSTAIRRSILANLKMLRALAGHLGQVGDAEYLPILPELAQQAPDHLGDRAPDTAIHLIKD
jgi:hypothetical protein